MGARVVRVGRARNGNGSNSSGEGSNQRAVGLHFALPFRPESNGNGHAKELERRESPRRPLAVPVRVRPEHIPWFEEAMTIDVSAHGCVFLAGRNNKRGKRLWFRLEPLLP